MRGFNFECENLSRKPLANGIRCAPLLIFETVGISRDSLSLCCSARNCSQFLPTIFALLGSSGAFCQIKAPNPVWNFFPLCSISQVSHCTDIVLCLRVDFTLPVAMHRLYRSRFSRPTFSVSASQQYQAFSSERSRESDSSL
jgi:hypothetical protein